MKHSEVKKENWRQVRVKLGVPHEVEILNVKFQEKKEAEHK